MNKIIVLMLMIFVVVLCLAACSNDPGSLEAEIEGEKNILEPTEPPIWPSNELMEYNHSSGYRVSVQDETLVVELTGRDDDLTAYPEAVKVHEVRGGKLVGEDYGEWGGSLSYVSASEVYKILNGNIRFFAEIDGMIYVFVGYDGMGAVEGGEGGMYRMNYNGKWSAVKVLDLETEPTALCRVGSSHYMLGSSRLLEIKDEKIVRVLVDDAFWGKGLYPAWMVHYQNRLVIGMRGGICSVSLKTKKQEWYDMNEFWRTHIE